MSEKINVLVVPSDKGGCGFYRSLQPHVCLDKLYGDEFNVEINYQPDWSNLALFDKYDLIHIHKGLCPDMNVFYAFLDYCKEKKIVTVLDLDDNWKLNPDHPGYYLHKKSKSPELICENIKRFDYVTTTTEIFAEQIRKVKGNNNVFVIPNAINPEEIAPFVRKNPSNKLRIGLVMGSSHKKDVEQLKGFANMLNSAGLLDSVQIVLCGFDLNGTVTVLDENGEVKGIRPITPKESVWTEYESIMTDDYKIVSLPYRMFLQKYFPKIQYGGVDNEPYRREWTKPINEYMSHYQNIDVLLAPLDCNYFTEVKSELKFIEAGFTHTAVIASDFGPYTIGSVNMLEKGGAINKDGNCILIDPSKSHKAWLKAVKKLVENPELVTVLQENMYNHVKDKYDLRNVTKERAELYKKLTNK